jgi:nicotinamide mononucleotide (NMN) deamidase PncC
MILFIIGLSLHAVMDCDEFLNSITDDTVRTYLETVRFKKTCDDFYKAIGIKAEERDEAIKYVLKWFNYDEVCAPTDITDLKYQTRNSVLSHLGKLSDAILKPYISIRDILIKYTDETLKSGKFEFMGFLMEFLTNFDKLFDEGKEVVFKKKDLTSLLGVLKEKLNKDATAVSDSAQAMLKLVEQHFIARIDGITATKGPDGVTLSFSNNEFNIGSEVFGADGKVKKVTIPKDTKITVNKKTKGKYSLNISPTPITANNKKVWRLDASIGGLSINAGVFAFLPGECNGGVGFEVGLVKEFASIQCL